MQTCEEQRKYLISDLCWIWYDNKKNLYEEFITRIYSTFKIVLTKPKFKKNPPFSTDQ